MPSCAVDADVVGAGAVGAEHDRADLAGSSLRLRSTTAPAPSANTAAVERSSGSVIRDIRSAPIARATRARPASIWAVATASAERKPVQAEPTSKAPARVAPSACATSGAAAGISSSEVVVATITRSTSSGSIAGPRQRLARRLGGVVVQPLVGLGDPARADPGAADDPVVLDAEPGADLGAGDHRSRAG